MRETTTRVCEECRLLIAGDDGICADCRDLRGASRDVNGHAFIGSAPWICVRCREVVPLNARFACAPAIRSEAR